MKKLTYVFTCLFLISATITYAAAPVVSNLTASQRTDGSRLVDVYYDLEDTDSEFVYVSVMFSDDNGANYDVEPEHIYGDVGMVKPGTDKHAVWNAGRDVPNVFNSKYGVSVTADDSIHGKTMMINIPGLDSEIKPLVMVKIPAGTNVMGSPQDETKRDDDEGPQHDAVIQHDFYISQYEITQGQWEHIMGNNPSNNTGSPDYPVENISYNDCIDFTSRLNALGFGHFRLPTEREWEYACRAGTTTAYFWGEEVGYVSEDGWVNAIDQFGWYTDNSGGVTHEVGALEPNPWGLYDIVGNVSEWTSDLYYDYETGETNRRGGDRAYVYRGGACNQDSWLLRSASRDFTWEFSHDNDQLTSSYKNVGLRVVMEIE